MRMGLECVTCFIRQAVKASRAAGAVREATERAVREVMRVLLREGWDRSPPEVARPVYRAIRSALGVNDPYREVKRRSNEEMMALYPRLKEVVRRASDPLEAAVRVAIAGNVIDYAALETYDVMGTVEEVFRKDFAINDYWELSEAVRGADKLLYFADNAGEIVADKLLIETMIRVRGRPFTRVTFVVKGGPIINDATVEDAMAVGIPDIPNLTTKTISNGDPGTGPDRGDPEVLKWFEEHDLRVLKGQGNYEGFDSFKDSFFLLIVKCEPVASSIGAKVGGIVLKHNP